MRDQHQRQTAFAHQTGQQMDDLRLNRDIQRRRRLVRDDQVGIARQCHRNDDALLHAARQLVRIGRTDGVGLRNAQLGQQRDGARPRRFAVQPQVRAGHEIDLWANALHRVQCCHRVLGDKGNPASAQGPQLALGLGDHVGAVEFKRPCGDAPADQRQQAGQRKCCQRFARSAFSNQPHDLALGQVKADAFQQGQCADAHRQVFDT